MTCFYRIVKECLFFFISKENEVPKRAKALQKDDADHLTILNILLQNPEELDLKHKPSAIRENKIFTLDKREIPISSAEADDNGAYISKGSVKQYYTYGLSNSTTAHKSENGAWYVNVKASKGYKRKYVSERNVYELTRLYRTSKNNPDFSRTIAFVQECNENEPKPFYLVMYRWARDDQGPRDFVLPRHGNASRPTTNAYYRQDPKIFSEIDSMLEKGMSTDSIYSSISQQKEATVSQTVTGPKVIENRKYASKKSSSDDIQPEVQSEAEVLVSSLHTISMVNSVTFSKEQYLSVTVCLK